MDAHAKMVRLSLWLALCVACQGELGASDSQAPDAALSGPEDAAADAAQVPGLEPDASTEDAGVEAPDPNQVCSEDGWCFESPYPSAEDIHGAAQLGDALAMVGARGRILHARDDKLRGMVSGTEQDLHAVLAFAADDAWAVGDGSTFVHFDGESWTPTLADAADGGTMPSDDLRALWGASRDDVWAVGLLGALWHYDGTGWTKHTSPTGKNLHAIWGAAADRVIAVGDDGVALDYDGEQWRASTFTSGVRGLSVHGTSASDIWVGTADGRLFHFDGTRWSGHVPPFGQTELHVVLARAENEVFVAGAGGSAAVFDGTSWRTLTVGSTETLHALLHDGKRLWAMGGHGFVSFFEGEARTILSRGGRANYLDLSAGQAVAPWVVGDGTLRLSAEGPVAVESGTERVLYGCYALSDALAWGVGSAGTIVRWDGTAMKPAESGSDAWLRAVWAASEHSVWIVGEQGTVLGLFNGTSWLPVEVPTREDLFDVWGAAANDVWVAGDRGTLLHHDGAAWSAVTLSTSVRLTAVWGRSASDVYVAGASGTLLHWNGKAWSALQEGSSYTLYGLGGDEASVYAVGSGGTVLHGKDGVFSRERTPTGVSLFGVGRGADGALRAVGADGVVLIKRTR